MIARRVRAMDLMGFREDGKLKLSAEEHAVLDSCRASFLAFLPYWQFKNRETGEIASMGDLWEGQRRFAQLMQEEPWILALKAGKLGFTELECAYDAWVALFRQANARVHLFSMDLRAAQQLLAYIRFGITHLPPFLKLPIMGDVAGGDTSESLKLDGGPDDVRTIVSYAANPHAAIDQSATHSHVDELARMPFAEQTWSAIETTVAPDGSCHIVTRGAGDANYVATLWAAASEGNSRLAPFFVDWTARPGRDRTWREEHAASQTLNGILFFAPESPEDALAGDDTAVFLDMVSWDRCCDPSLPPLLPGDPTALVMGIDASVSGDMFGVVLASRHPERHDDPAIRLCLAWDPKESGGHVDFDEVERWVRIVCEGACPEGHPRNLVDHHCSHCRAGRFSKGLNVVLIVYDPYQMEDMAQRLERDGVAWLDPCDQGSERLISDSIFHKQALSRRLAHTGDPLLREHISNCRVKLSKDDDSKLRIIKKAPNRKIDLAVAASMAVKRVLELNL